MAPQYPKEFGKRPPPSAPQQPIKRSGHVALLVMGTIAAGTTAYALMPATKCDPLPDKPAPAQAAATPAQAAATPAQAAATPAQANAGCAGNGASGGHGGWWSRSSYFGGYSSSHSSSQGSSDHGSGGVTRGGFGSWAHGFFGGS